MTIMDPGYSEAAATVFTWLADKVLGGVKKVGDWGWERAQWAAAQDRYDEQIIKQYGWIRIFGQTTPKPLKEVFTDVYMLDKPTAFSRFDPDTLRKHLWEQDRGLPFRFGERLPADQLLGRGSKFFILGKPGAGKTTFLKHLAVREAQRGKWGPCLGKIPIFVPLKQFAESGRSLFDFIVEQFTVCHFPDAAPFVEPLLKEGRALVLFDGLDEVTREAEADTRRRGQVTETIEQFSRQYDSCHIVITCRIAATEYTFDPAFIYLELADFAPDQVEAFVCNWFWDADESDRSAGLAERMLTEWAKPEHAGVRDLTRSPLLLTLLCLNYAETLSFPARRVEIYQEALDALLKKWDSSRQIRRSSLYGTLSLGRKQQMFSRIAWDGFLQDEILFPQADLEARLKAYLVHVPGVPLAIDIDAEAVLAEIVEQHGIFSQQAHGLFSFAHLTFQEYYAARFIANDSGSGALGELLNRIDNDKWREVFLLTASLLADATIFLTSFESNLQRLVARRPQLAAWLRWIDTRAMVSKAVYRRPARRVFYVLARIRSAALSHTLAIAHNRAASVDISSAQYRARIYTREITLLRALDFDQTLINALAYTLKLDHDLADDVSIALAIDRDLDVAHRNDANFDLYMTRRISEIRRRTMELCQQQRRTDLFSAIAALEVPTAGDMSSLWPDLAKDLDTAVRASLTPRGYWEFDIEAKALTNPKTPRWPLDQEDMKTLLVYTDATNLFYDCLQLAYTPNRREFEDRIFLPSPLSTQEA